MLEPENIRASNPILQKSSRDRPEAWMRECRDRMGRGKKSTEPKPSKTVSGLGFEEKLWAAADKLRGHMDAGEYKHVAVL